MLTSAQAAINAEHNIESLLEHSIANTFKAVEKAIEESRYSCKVEVLPVAINHVGEVLRKKGFTAYTLVVPPMCDYDTLYIHWYKDSHLPEDQQSEIKLPSLVRKVWTNRKIYSRENKQESKSTLSKVCTWLKSK